MRTASSRAFCVSALAQPLLWCQRLRAHLRSPTCCCLFQEFLHGTDGVSLGTLGTSQEPEVGGGNAATSAVPVPPPVGEATR